MMIPRSRSFSPGDVVIVPFPFTERLGEKRRPALVVSTRDYIEASAHVVLAMITTATRFPWPGDVGIVDLAATGLPKGSTVRWKIFTLDASLVLRRVGALADGDRASCERGLPVRIQQD